MASAPIYSDGFQNHYVGDCIWHNPDISYPLDYYLDTVQLFDGVGNNRFNFVDTVSALFGQINIPFVAHDIGEQTTGNYYIKTVLSVYKPGSDLIPDRFWLKFDGDNVNNEGLVRFLWNSYSSANLKAHIPQSEMGTVGLGQFGADGRRESIVMAYSPEHFAFLQTRYSVTENNYKSIFRYGARLSGVNSNFNYYNKDDFTTAVVAGFNQEAGSTSFTNLKVYHYTDSGVVQENDAALQNGDADYTFVCADAQTPTADWATNFFIFDDNNDLGNPAIGAMPGLLIAQGTYTLFKPVKITSAATADSGSPWFLPVASYHTDKTVLMRVHSSMV